MSKDFTDTISLVAEFAKRAKLCPENCQTLLNYIAENKLPLDWETLCQSHKKLLDGYYAHEKKITQSGLTREQIEGWSADRLRAELKTRGDEINSVLNGS